MDDSHRRRRLSAALVTGGGAFVPTSIANLVGWWDFSDATTLWQDTGRTVPVVSNGDPIKGVTDKSGTAKHLTQAANFPTYETASQNGLSTVSMVTTILTSVSFTALNSPFTVFVACRRADSVRTNNADLFSAVGTFVPLIAGTSVNGFWTFYDGTALPSAVVQDTAFHEVHAVFNGASSTLTLDGTDISTGDVGTLATSTTFGFNGLTAGHSYKIGELFIYNAVVSVPNIAAAKLYLKTKWGTP